MNRTIFEFHDGIKERREDGTKLIFKYQASMDDDFRNSVAMLDAPLFPERENETADQKAQREKHNAAIARAQGKSGSALVQVARDLFQIPEYHFDGKSETGLTDAEALTVFYDFVYWTAELKKNTEQPQLQRPSLAAKPRARKKKN